MIFAGLLLMAYLLAGWPARSALTSVRLPVRAALVVFAGAVLAAYVSVNRVRLPTTVTNGADRGLLSLPGWAGVLLVAAGDIRSGGPGC